MERCVKPASLKSVKAVRSRIAKLKQHLGELPLDGIEEPDEINRFKTESDYAERVELATLNRALETLPHAMNGEWRRRRRSSRSRRSTDSASA